MKIFTRAELDQLIGKAGLLNRQVLAGKVTYISGIEALEPHTERTSTWDIAGLINFCKRPKGLEIQLVRLLNTWSVAISDDKILSIDLESKEQIYEKKEKSVVGRALIGGILLGPLGAVIGGMSGIGTTDVKKDMPDMILSIRHLDSEGNTLVSVFSAKYKDKPEIDRFFAKIALNKYNVNTV